MRKKFFRNSAIILMLFSLFSCQKQSKNFSNDKVVMDAQAQTEVSDKSMKSLFFSGNMNEKDVIVQSKNNESFIRRLVPFKEKDGVKVFRYRLKEYTSKGTKLYYIVSKTRLTSQADLFSIQSEADDIIYYNQGKPKAKIIARLNHQKEEKSLELNVSANRVLPSCEDGQNPEVCIDWYWTTYNVNTGEVYEETFLYTTCHSSCTSGGGAGGGGGGTNCNDTRDELEGGPISVGISASVLSESLTTRTQAYVWKFYKQSWALWSFSSHEKGAHQKINNVWKWQSLTHESISKSGIWVGGTVNCTLNSAIPQMGQYYAGMQLNYTIQADAICSGFPIGLSKTCSSNSPQWNVTTRYDDPS